MTIKTVTLTFRGQEYQVPSGLEVCFIQAMEGGETSDEALARATRLAKRRLSGSSAST